MAHRFSGIRLDGHIKCPMCGKERPLKDYIEEEGTTSRNSRVLRVVQRNGGKARLRRLCSTCVQELRSSSE
jgi:hypothetical protein